ncbi:MAG: hypothetical protein JWQ99_254 [Blastococcus sp.]|jgi:hypothetical protein|nr:hypothetical protein [Blastococcus sp.]
MRRGQVIAGIVFYGGLVLLMASILLQFLADVLPDGTARRIGFNSEGFVLALIVAGWIQFARPRLRRSRTEWPATLLVGLVLVAVGVGLLVTDLPSRFRTLNETFLAAGLVVPYLQLPRPLPRWVPLAISGTFFAVIVLFSRTELVTGLAETLGALVLLPLAVDVFDRHILDADARPSGGRYGFYAALVLVPITFSVLERVLDPGGVLHPITRYGVRLHESFICVVLVVAYFAVLRAVQNRASSGRHSVPAGALAR